jgi:putative addiction module killer protein
MGSHSGSGGGKFDGESKANSVARDVSEIDKSPSVLYAGQVAILQTETFRDWLDGLRDRKARLRIDDRLKRLAGGNAGDTRSVGDGVRELRLHFGPGDRVYYIWRDGILIILLNGGDKGSQRRDIDLAKQLAKEADDDIETSPVRSG